MIKEIIEKISLKGFYEAQESVAVEAQKMMESIRVNGKPLDKLKKGVRH